MRSLTHDVLGIIGFVILFLIVLPYWLARRYPAGAIGAAIVGAAVLLAGWQIR